jgi:hypothetical protein
MPDNALAAAVQPDIGIGVPSRLARRRSRQLRALQARLPGFWGSTERVTEYLPHISPRGWEHITLPAPITGRDEGTTEPVGPLQTSPPRRHRALQCYWSLAWYFCRSVRSDLLAHKHSRVHARSPAPPSATDIGVHKR